MNFASARDSSTTAIISSKFPFCLMYRRFISWATKYVAGFISSANFRPMRYTCRSVISSSNVHCRFTFRLGLMAPKNTRFNNTYELQSKSYRLWYPWRSASNPICAGSLLGTHSSGSCWTLRKLCTDAWEGSSGDRLRTGAPHRSSSRMHCSDWVWCIRESGTAYIRSRMNSTGTPQRSSFSCGVY